ncbi:MAG: hypothetical protein WD070_07195 [Pirellulaceae bacterium]
MCIGSRLAAAEPPITAAAFTSDGKSIVVGSQTGIRVYAWPELTEQQTLASRLVQIHDLVFSPDGQLLAAIGGRPAEEGLVELFTWPSTKFLRRQTIGDDVLYRAAWQAAGEHVAVAGPGRGITLLDRTAHVVHQIEGHSRDVVAIAFLPDGHFISGSRDNTIRVWQSPSNELIRTLDNHTHEIHDIAVRPGSAGPPHVIASSGEDRTVRFWWPVRGRLMRFAKLPSPALDIEWTPDGAKLIAACADGHLRTIDPDSVRITQDLEVGPGWLYTVAITPDGASAFVGGASGLMRAVKIR